MVITFPRLQQALVEDRRARSRFQDILALILRMEKIKYLMPFWDYMQISMQKIFLFIETVNWVLWKLSLGTHHMLYSVFALWQYYTWKLSLKLKHLNDIVALLTCAPLTQALYMAYSRQMVLTPVFSWLIDKWVPTSVKV